MAPQTTQNAVVFLAYADGRTTKPLLCHIGETSLDTLVSRRMTLCGTDPRGIEYELWDLRFEGLHCYAGSFSFASRTETAEL